MSHKDKTQSTSQDSSKKNGNSSQDKDNKTGTSIDKDSHIDA